MTKYISIFIAFLCFFLPQQSGATTYYIAYDCADTSICGNGTASTTPFSGLDEFVEVARSAGDIAIVKRGTASTTNISDILPTSDGTLNNPIIITADYDNIFNNFATSSQTYTPVQGSKTMEASASITGIAANDWIYVAGDCYETYNNTNKNPCEYAYEVASVSGTTLTLYLPYKGSQSGSGKDLRVLPDLPVWNSTTGDFQWFINQDHYWHLKGLDLRGTDANCVILSSNSYSSFEDIILQTDGTSSCGFNTSSPNEYFSKIRFFGGVSFISALSNQAQFKDALIDCNNTSSSYFINDSSWFETIYVSATEIINCTGTSIGSSLGNNGGGGAYFNGVSHNNTYTSLSGASPTKFFFEDNYNVIGLNSQTDHRISDNTLATTTVSTTTQLRTGGGPKNLYIIPPDGTGNTGISTKNYPRSNLKLFEYPIYTDTSSKTYTMYFRTSATSAFTINPLTQTATGSTTPELYIECEYYPGSDADRVLKRSNTASAVSFTSDTNWYGISVTCQPGNAGLLYLRGWYAKPREAVSNEFYMDLTPEIS